MPPPKIEACGLEKRYDNGLIRALDGLNLEVSAGESVAIMGPTGCGKSTLLNLLALLDQPNRGELRIDGRPAETISPAEAWRASDLGIIFQLHHLLPYLTAEENVMVALMSGGHRRRTIRRRARSLLSNIGLEHRAETVATKLSGGERQLVAVARALVTDPSLILADEPTGSVDSLTGKTILERIFKHCSSTGATIILVTHDPSVATYADRLVRMRDGRIVQSNPAPVNDIVGSLQ